MFVHLCAIDIITIMNMNCSKDRNNSNISSSSSIFPEPSSVRRRAPDAETDVRDVVVVAAAAAAAVFVVVVAAAAAPQGFLPLFLPLVLGTHTPLCVLHITFFWLKGGNSVASLLKKNRGKISQSLSHFWQSEARKKSFRLTQRILLLVSLQKIVAVGGVELSRGSRRLWRRRRCRCCSTCLSCVTSQNLAYRDYSGRRLLRQG